jgi:NTE family protein
MPTVQLSAANVAFTVVFGFFLVVVAVLIVVTTRFIVQRGADSRRRWQSGADLPADGAGDRPEAGREPEAEPEPARQMTALVLGGGGTRGAAQVGMLQVLAESGFVPDLILGTSVGAVNGAAFAGNPTVEGVAHLTRIWQGISGVDVYPQRRVRGPWQFLQQRESVHSNTGLLKIIEDGIAYDRLEDAAVPFEVVATSLNDGSEQWLSTGPAVQAVLASAAIPAIFPPVEIGDERLIDGGVVNNVPLLRALDAGATRIVVLLCGPPVFTPAAARRPVEAMINALFISIHARFPAEMARLPDGVEVVVMSGGDTMSRDYTDFSNTDVLIERGRAEATEVLLRSGVEWLGTVAGTGTAEGTEGIDGTEVAGGATVGDGPADVRPVSEDAGSH